MKSSYPLLMPRFSGQEIPAWLPGIFPDRFKKHFDTVVIRPEEAIQRGFRSGLTGSDNRTDILRAPERRRIFYQCQRYRGLTGRYALGR